MNTKFNELFCVGVDDTERGHIIGDTIHVRQYHSWSFDSLMEEVVIYAFINYWKSYGKCEYKFHQKEPSSLRGRIHILRGLHYCYHRIKYNHEIFFGEISTWSDDYAFRKKTIEFIWKYRGLMWD